jgi:polar amino acid transport system substrate-binding protein
LPQGRRAGDKGEGAFCLALLVGNFPRQVLVDYSMQLPGSRVLEDSYGLNRVGIAMQQGQAGRLAYIGEFVEEAKASGLIQRSIERGGLREFQVAPHGNTSTE